MDETKDTESQGPQPKKPYEKPRVKRVELRPEEAVLGSCKTGAAAGPGAVGCSTLGVGCSTAGS